MRRRLGTLGLALACVIASLGARGADILLVGAQHNDGIAAFTQALRDLRPADSVRFQPLADAPAPGRLAADTRLILLDPPSLDWRLQEHRGPATLVLRISRLQARQRLGEQVPPRLSLLWSDPPLARQLRLTRQLLPQAKRVGVLYSDGSEFLLRELHHLAGPMGLELVAQRWDNIADSRPLQHVLGSSDVLLGLDDPQLYNSKTAKNLLLSTYARQQALIGPNAGFVKAGALASTYSDQDDWLAVLDTLLDRPPSQWPRSLYPTQFKVQSNPQVARSLGLEPIDEPAMAIRLAEGEQRP